MAAKSLEQFFNALHPFLLAPKYKVFKATKFSSSNGRHTQGEYVVDKNTKPLYFYFGDRFKERFEVAKEVRAYLVEHLPKRGAHLMQVDAGFLAFDYRYVTTYSDHFSSEHEIQIVATVVRSESSFLSTTKQ